MIKNFLISIFFFLILNYSAQSEELNFRGSTAAIINKDDINTAFQKFKVKREIPVNEAMERMFC